MRNDTLFLIQNKIVTRSIPLWEFDYKYMFFND